MSAYEIDPSGVESIAQGLRTAAQAVGDPSGRVPEVPGLGPPLASSLRLLVQNEAWVGRRLAEELDRCSRDLDQMAARARAADR